MHAFLAHIGDDGAALRNMRSGKTQQFQLLFGFEKRAFAGQRPDDETGQRRARPFLEVMLDLDAIHGAGVIERRRDRRIHSLDFHLTYMFSIDLDCTQSKTEI